MVKDDNDNKIYLTAHGDGRARIIKRKEKHNRQRTRKNAE